MLHVNQTIAQARGKCIQCFLSSLEAVGAPGWEGHIVLFLATLPQPVPEVLSGSFSVCWFKTSRYNKGQNCCPCYLSPKEGKWVIFSLMYFFFAAEKKHKTQNNEPLKPSSETKTSPTMIHFWSLRCGVSGRPNRASYVSFPD